MVGMAPKYVKPKESATNGLNSQALLTLSDTFGKWRPGDIFIGFVFFPATRTEPCFFFRAQQVVISPGEFGTHWNPQW